jgi:hypothetical protein
VPVPAQHLREAEPPVVAPLPVERARLVVEPAVAVHLLSRQ